MWQYVFQNKTSFKIYSVTVCYFILKFEPKVFLDGDFMILKGVHEFLSRNSSLFANRCGHVMKYWPGFTLPLPNDSWDWLRPMIKQ